MASPLGPCDISDRDLGPAGKWTEGVGAAWPLPQAGPCRWPQAITYRHKQEADTCHFLPESHTL